MHNNRMSLLNKRQRIPKRQSKMVNPEKLATQGTRDEEKHNTIIMCWTPLCVNKHNINKT